MHFVRRPLRLSALSVLSALSESLKLVRLGDRVATRHLLDLQMQLQLGASADCSFNQSNGALPTDMALTTGRRKRSKGVSSGRAAHVARSHTVSHTSTLLDSEAEMVHAMR